ncbi:hypothetical protein Gohar_016161, partial [Gossypium harknessii]|nr:hypothetical protein [Gossypium harknessii]
MVLGAANGLVWMDGEGEEEEDAVSSWTPNINNQIQSKQDDFTMPFKSMLDADWYMNPAMNQDPHIRELGFVDNNLLLHHPLDSSASCSPSQPFTLEPHPFLPPKPCFSSLLCNSPFDFASETAFQPNQTPNFMGFPPTQFSTPDFSSSSNLQGPRLFTATENASAFSGGFEGFDASGNAVFVNRAKILKPLEVFPSVGSQPTLFQKRA